MGFMTAGKLLAVLAVVQIPHCFGSLEKGHTPFRFTHHLYNATICENSVPKTYVISNVKMGIIVTDPFWKIKYKLVSGDEDGLFKTEEYTVGDFCFLRIRTRSSNAALLNREVRDSYTLTIQSTESMYEYEARTKVVIHVLDANDLKPLFYPASYNVTVKEDTPLRSSVLKVSATDADLGSNGEFYYSFTSRSSPFAIDPSTGTITLAKKLQYNHTPKYELRVLAEDRTKKIAGVRKFGNDAKVVINVKKVNPEPPVIKSVTISTPDGDDEETYAAVEVGSTVKEVESLTIVKGDPQHYFQIIPSHSGSRDFQVVATKKLNWLNYPLGFNLSIQAKDKHNPPLLSEIKAVHIPFPRPAPLKFEKKIYSVTLSEFSPPNTPVIRVVVNPSPLNVTYHIKKTPDSTKFRINAKSGLIVITEQLDYEKESHYEFDVMANHGEAEAKVTVDIIDENDNAPKFARPSYQGTVLEHVPIGNSILTVTAVDGDTQKNGFITYAIANKGPLPFTIDPFTGVISTSEELDYELMQRWYHLRVWASDSGAPYSHVTECAVTLIMSNINDNIPEFEKVGCNATIPQDLAVGEIIGVMSAIDLDELQQVRYKMESGNELGLFEISPVSGKILLKKRIPVISSAGRLPSYSLTITATDGENYAVPTTVNVVVKDKGIQSSMKCEDTGVFKKLTEKLIQSIKPETSIQEADSFSDIHIINRHSPKFDGSLPSSIDVREDMPVNSTILQFKAADEDTGFNGKLVYVISDGNEDGCFTIDMESGEVKLLSPLDRETTGFYILNITVYDLGISQRSSWKFLAVNVLDVNDNPPRFEQSKYILTIPENTGIEKSILQVKAVDVDLEVNGKIKYSLITETDKFAINDYTGVVRVNKPLDREVSPRYELKIEARDQATVDPTLFSIAEIVVILEDVNDNPPTFVPKFYKVQVPEDVPIGTIILWVEIYDPDLGSGGQVSYNLMDNENGAFYLEASIGSLSLEKEMDFEQRQFYNLTIRAVDHGQPRSLSSSCFVEVEVLDVNENLNAPLFSSFVYKAEVVEDTPVGTSIMSLTAVDKDRGRDGVVRYYIREGSGLGVFSIDEDTGIIRTADILDRESTPHYWLTVYATDLGAVPLVSWTEVFIEVMDINDNPPEFSQPVYFGSVLENSPQDKFILRVEASDADIASEGKLTFQILDTQRTYFTIGSKTGVISTSAPLDREQKAEHILEVTVSDNGKPPLRSTATVIIQVLDVNDNSPRFAHKLFYVRLPERQDVREPQEVYRMIAHDNDDGPNARVTYSLKEDADNTFSIDPITGIVSSESNFGPGAYSILTIKATDSGSPNRSSTSRLDVEWIPKPAPTSEMLAFDEPHFNFAVMETDPVTHMVGIISTEITQSLLWFNIIGGDSEKEFDIEKNSGSIVIARPLDAGKRSNYNLTVRVTDGTQSIKTQAYIRVVDINKHRPEFLKSHYEVKVPEDTAPWKEILQLSAQDKDGSSSLVYTIQSSMTPASVNFFSLNPNSGALVLTEKLDFETLPVHTLTVMVRDQEIPVKRNFVKVVVHVEDCNDHAPAFMSSRYEGRVLNMATAGAEVLQVKALDKDKGSNAEIIYTFLSGNTEGAFAIDPKTGRITVAKPLDNLPQENYQITVEATDQGFPQRSDISTVVIHINLSVETPPRFLINEYFAEISEAAPVGSPVTTVSASSPSGVRYQIKDGDPNGTFQINSFSGVLSTQKALDFEKNSSYQLEIRGSTLSGTFSDTIVFVYVIDENDNAPSFLREEFIGQISESAHENSMVMGELNTPLVIQATDADKDSNALLVYQILEPEVQKVFRIEPSMGTLFLTSSVDFEVTSEFQFSVQVHDSGEPPLYASKPSKVTVRVLDINDCPPKFLKQQYESSLILPAFQGMEVIKVLASDADSDVIYSINEGNVNNAFAIHPSSGLITVNNASNLRQNYQLFVKASDGLYKDTALIKVNFTSITGHGLVFQNKFYVATVSENSTSVKTLLVVRASGSYLNEPLIYSVSNSDGMFSVIPTSGVLETTGIPFDRERQDVYDVAVEVRDTRDPPRRALTYVKVYVDDINDNAPEFLNLPYAVTVQDDADPGDVLFQVTATDKDLGENGAVMFSLQDDFDLFRIDPYLGDVSLQRSLDFESMNKYVLTVIASDVGDPSLTSEAELIVQVRNRSNPIFQKLHYLLNIPENISPFTTILHVQARNPEGYRLIYNLVEENASKNFHIDFKTGVLSVTDFLDYEAQTKHTFTVRATDSVTGTYSEAKVDIEIEDINDNPPLFQQKTYTAHVSEGSPIGTSVIQVSATDKDSGKNKAILYQIVETGQNDNTFFSVDALTGLVVTTHELDYEATQQFHLKIRAIDNGVPPLSSEAFIVVNVSDVNDNPPAFNQAQYDAALNEMAMCGHIVIKVQASDPDSINADNLEYMILSGNNDRHFAINHSSGIISFSNVCKRSLDPFYNLTIAVSDGVFKRTAPVNINMMNINKHSPHFEQNIYEAELAENAEAGTQVIRLAAIDPDDGPYGSVDYTIINKLADEKFSIDKNGQIVTTQALDRENPTQRVIAIKVMAKDGGGKVAFCTVKIILTDENDNAPQFKASEYQVSIQSSLSKGSPVIQIMAYDADEGKNADVTYTVDEAEEVTEDIIEINPFTGVISVKESLVGLENKIFNFKVKARDGGSPYYNSSVPVQLNVVPSEVTLPQFSEPLYTFSASEDIPVGSEVGTIKADADIPLIYSLVEGNTVESNKERVFAVDSDSGTLLVQKSIDHEKTNWYQIDVMAQCNHNGTDVASIVSVSIQVQDVNDNSPVFEADPYRAFLTENMPAGTTVIQVTAIDPDTDTNGQVSYRLESESDSINDVFMIDNESGWITTLKETDCETNGFYVFHVVATDHGGKVKLSSSALVNVTITDENDSPPVFTEEVYQGSVVENSPPGEDITTVSTTDADVSEANRQVTCYITDGDPLGQFSMEQNGQEWKVKLKDTVDREVKEKYTLKITATDGRFQAFSTVEIHVLDINDNSPQCEQLLYTEVVPENSPSRLFILKVSAKDPDLGTNGQVVFTLHGPSAEKFHLDPLTGELFTLAVLDREQQMEYDLVVKATDGGGRSCQADIMLMIQDMNDNAPRFSSDHYVVTVFDNTTVKTPIAVVYAKDPDTGINSEVVYSLIDSDSQYFSLDEFSGIIRLEAPLTDESKSPFEMKVQATDRGLPRHLFSVSTVTVNVVDLSDYIPVFLNTEYVAEIPESTALGTEVLSVSALAKDGDQNADIVYSIISGNERGKFSMDSKTGDLYVNGSLDFEQCQEYYLSVEGMRGKSSSLSDITTVIINITDVNDNPPIFSHGDYSAEVPEDIALGETVTQVSADDLDGPLNNRIQYSIVSGDPWQQFSMDPASGEIRVIRHLDREEITHYSLTVLAADSGEPPLSSAVQVTVKVSDVNDNPPVFSQLNHSLAIQEGDPVGSSILQLVVTDRDTQQNGPPFSFRIVSGNEGKHFQVDQGGRVSTASILRKKLREMYLLEVQVTDSGYPPLSSTCLIKLSVTEQSKYPPSAVPLEVFITTVDKVFVGSVIGNIHAADRDLHDVLSYKLISESAIKKRFEVDTANGKITVKDVLEPGQYILNVTISDGKFTTRTAVQVHVWGATQQVLDQGITLRLDQMTPEAFIRDHWWNLQHFLGDMFNIQSKRIHVASLQHDQNSEFLDLLLVWRQHGSLSPLSREKLSSIVQGIKDSLGISIMEVNHGSCMEPGCPSRDCKSTVRMSKETNSTYTTESTSFITPQHSWEIVCSCNESAIMFNGNSFLKYHYHEDAENSKLKLTLRIKTYQQHGLVMTTNGTHVGSLEIVDKELKFKYSCGNGLPGALGVRNVPISDGRWHQVLLEVNSTVLRVTLDKLHSSAITLSEPCSLLRGKSPLVFGGPVLPAPVDTPARGFKGCLDALELNGEAIRTGVGGDALMGGVRRVTGIYQCCSPTESCSFEPCQNGGTCTTQSNGEFQCSCPPQYFGSRCEADNDPCQSQPCANGGVCVAEGQGYICHCPEQNTGSRCESHIDVCSPNPCEAGFECKVSAGEPPRHECVNSLPVISDRLGVREIIEICAALLGVLLLVGAFIFLRKRYLQRRKHKPISTQNSNGYFHPKVAKSLVGDTQEVPPIEMNIMAEPRNNLDQDNPLKTRGQNEFSTVGGGPNQKVRGAVVCSVAPNLPPPPPSSSDNESVLKNNWELDYDVYPGDNDYYCPPSAREFPQFDIVEDSYPAVPSMDPRRAARFGGFPFPLERYDRRAPLPPCYSNQNLDDFLGPDGLPLPAPQCLNEYTAISYYPTEHVQGLENVSGNGYRRLNMRLSVAQPSYADCNTLPHTGAPLRTPRTYEGSDMVESDYGSCEEVMF
uniref:FAT atypical cadherin 2 n=1 Tax=Lepisosteus oculatus TaxID=7918 RepID=W5N170_LEPOC|nr:PREDICTED: protocadherin Fat 2 [Lepisosteus oculatus]